MFNAFAEKYSKNNFQGGNTVLCFTGIILKILYVHRTEDNYYNSSLPAIHMHTKF